MQTLEAALGAEDTAPSAAAPKGRLLNRVEGSAATHDVAPRVGHGQLDELPARNLGCHYAGRRDPLDETVDAELVETGATPDPPQLCPISCGSKVYRSSKGRRSQSFGGVPRNRNDVSRIQA